MKHVLLSIGQTKNKQKLLPFIKNLSSAEYKLYAKDQTSKFLSENEVPNTLLYKISQKHKQPNLAEFLIEDEFDLIINIPTRDEHTADDLEYTAGQYIRQKAIENQTHLVTDVEVAIIYLKSLAKDFQIDKVTNGKDFAKVGPFAGYYGSLYNIHKSYDFNYEFGPFFKGPYPDDLAQLNQKKSKQEFLGFKLNSLFGIPAGPLLNANWVKTYARLGFDLLTYKTVLTSNKACHQQPNIVFINPEMIKDFARDKKAYSTVKKPLYKQISITNSFGVPSKEPDVWQEDLKRLLPQLQSGQLLILSVMGTARQGMNEQEYIDDFVKCAQLGVEAKAPVIEVNLSCPNLGTGAIFNDENLSRQIVKQVKAAIGEVPLLVKIGYFKKLKNLKSFVNKTAEYVDGYVSINTVPKKVVKKDGSQALPGKTRKKSGICGALIKPAGLEMVENLDKIRTDHDLDYVIVGVGGVMVPADYEAYLEAGADAVQAATGPMWNPYLAYQIKKQEF